ncbi:MAG: sugar ABC transporter ATP-binding protein [Eubacteriales bacterium]|nr:sugar ABC transporter ATP-binding protein [Eubacteriales bacterium]
MHQKVLEMKNIEKSFSGTHALRGINFDLELGEVHALLGENGAGKSTLIKILGGIHRPDSGTIVISGTEVKMENVHAAQKHGIGIIHQEIVLVPYLSVAANIFLGREPLNRFGLKDINLINSRATEMVRELGLNLDVRKPVVELTIAQQQMVEIIKAISFNVKILVMDEPTSSLSEEEVDKLFEIIGRLKKADVSIIYISHRMEELFKISDRITVIRDGTYVGTKKTTETKHDELVSMMVGRSLKNFYTRTECEIGEVVLAVDKLTKNGVFKNVSFQVRSGEILGFSGLIGSGRSEIMTAIFGGIPFDNGDVYLQNKKVRIRSTKQATDFGIGMVPEDRKKQGLMLNNTVGFNLTLASLKYLAKGFLVSTSKKKNVIQKYLQDLRIKTSSADALVSSLSGGNQQKVVLGKWLATKPKLLILDEPTRGVDVGAKSEIYAIINQLASEGIAIILVSSELPEIINMSDSVCVVRNGQIVKQLGRTELTQENIMLYATGGGIA